MSSPLHSRARRGTVVVATLATAALGLSIAPASAVIDASISGTVARTGDPGLSASLTAIAYEYDSGSESYVEVDSTPVVSGTYELTVPTDEYYYVGVVDADTHFATEFYVSSPTIQEAQSVYTDVDYPATEVDIEVDPIRLGGVVRDTSGAPLSDISVEAYSAASGYEESEYLTTDETGSYNFAGLPDGTYKLEFYDNGDGHLGEFYDNKTTLASATTIVVGAGDSVRDKDVVLVRPSSITGTMTTADGAPAVGGEVWVTQGTQEDPTYFGGAVTGTDGSYAVEGLPAGSYHVHFSYETGDTYFGEYWNDARWFEDATQVVVGTDGEITSQISPVMDDKTVKSVANLTVPTVTGTPQVGSTLTANSGSWDQPGATFTYYWDTYKQGNEHSDFLAEGPTYVPTADIVGQPVWLTVVASAPGFDNGYATSDTFGPIVAAPIVTPPVVTPPVVTPPVTDVDDSQKPKVQGAKKVGSTLKAKVASWIPAGATVKYQWLVNGKPIKKATKAKLKVSDKLAGKKVSVKVTATSAGSLPVTVTTKVGKIKG